jgi:hypothetical protein
MAKLSLIGILTDGVVQLPAQQPTLFVWSRSCREMHRAVKIEMELVAPSGQTLMQEQINIDPEAIAQGSGNLIAEIRRCCP